MPLFVPVAPIRLHRADVTPPISDLDVLFVSLNAALDKSPCSKAIVVAPTSTPMGLLTCLFMRCENAAESQKKTHACWKSSHVITLATTTTTTTTSNNNDDYYYFHCYTTTSTY